MPGRGTLTAAKVIAETAGVERFASDAKPDRRGNRQLNCAFHRIAVTQGRMHPPAREFLERKQAEGKSRREALRCLKRHLVRAVCAGSSESVPCPSQLSHSND